MLFVLIIIDLHFGLLIYLIMIFFVLFITNQTNKFFPIVYYSFIVLSPTLDPHPVTSC